MLGFNDFVVYCIVQWIEHTREGRYPTEENLQTYSKPKYISSDHVYVCMHTYMYD